MTPPVPPVRPEFHEFDQASAWMSQGRPGEALLAASVFKDAVRRERRRCDRFETPFSLVLVDRGDETSASRAWVEVVAAMRAVSRNVDVAGWLEDDRVLGLILPGASGAGALLVQERLQAEISDRLGRAAGHLSIRVYSHDGGGEAHRLPSVDLLLDAFEDERARPVRDVLKRLLDVAGSLSLIALFSPVLLTVWAAVKLSSPGPALYRQVRVGKDGKPFTMLKFRTMFVGTSHAIHQDYVTWFIKSSGAAPRQRDALFKLTNDPRITPVGRVLRRTSLDELPQFFNVLRGDMSLVGPRPPLPFEVEQYQPWHRRRVLEAGPGITGLWQTVGRSRTTFDEMVRLDLHYARTHTLWMDVKILAATPRAMVTGRGAC